MFEGPFGESMIKRAREKGAFTLKVIDLRSFSKDKHKKADDRPYGGGPGMVLSVEPIHRALDFLKKKKPKAHVILLSASGKVFHEKRARALSQKKRLIFICGHYEGVDERVKRWIDEDYSIGDYVLTCGEIPAMVMVDAVARLLPGVLGDSRSKEEESFRNGLLEYPHYTRPETYRGISVPRVLLSGNHPKIQEWRMEQAIKRTRKIRPELLKGRSR